MKEIAKIVESNIVTLILEMKDYDLSERNVIEIAQMFPVILVKSEKLSTFINLHEFSYTSGALEYLLFPDKVEESLQSEENHTIDIIDERSDIESRKRTGGQPTWTKLFLEIIDSTAEFIKQNGFAAQCRQRNDTGYSSGVSIREIREYWYAQFPNLKDHSISLSTIRRIFEAPNKSFVSSFHYPRYYKRKSESKIKQL